MAITLDDLFGNPDHYLHSFDGEDAVFVAMDRAAYARSIFLDDRIQPAAPGAMRVPIDALLGAVPQAGATRWIFHVAHCGSTLLARALEALDTGIVLREPLALRQVAVAQAGALLPLTLAMAAKHYPGGPPTLVKANVPVNFVLGDIAAAKPGDWAILLYHGLRAYLAAVLRGERHREWVRAVTGELAGYLGDLTGASDAERAAALWAAQMAHFAAATRQFAHVRSLDADRFYANPGATLAAAAAQLGIATDSAAIAALVSGPLFATYSKDPGQPFDNDARLARRRETEAALAGEFAEAEAWLAAHRPGAAEDERTVAAAALAA